MEGASILLSMLIYLFGLTSLIGIALAAAGLIYGYPIKGKQMNPLTKAGLWILSIPIFFLAIYLLVAVFIHIVRIVF